VDRRCAHTRDHRHQGTESAFGEGYPVAPVAHEPIPRRMSTCGAARERAANGRVGLRDAHRQRRLGDGELSNCYQSLLSAACKLLILWWAQQDSNLRLPPCEGGTLPLSYAPQEPPQRAAMALRLSYVPRIAFPLPTIKPVSGCRLGEPLVVRKWLKMPW
jgi:hypothetical protein